MGQRTPWDAGYHLLFEQPRVMRDLLRGFVPGEVLRGVTVESIEPQKTDFYNKHFKKRDGDMLVKLRRNDGTSAYLWFLLEFQVQPERFMAVRIGTYLFWLYEHLIQSQALGADGELPPVFAMVFYHGERKWSVPNGLGGLIALPKHSLLWPWQPQVRFHLLQEQEVDTGPLEHNKNVAGLLIRLNQCREAKDFAAVIGRLTAVVRGDEDRELSRLLLRWIVEVLAPKHEVDLTVQDVEPLVEDKTMGLEHHAEEIIQGFKNMGVAQGLLEGRKIGHAEGHKEGHAAGLKSGQSGAQKRALLTVLEARFGADPRWNALLEAAQSSERFDEVLRRATVADSADAFVREAREVLGLG